MLQMFGSTLMSVLMLGNKLQAVPGSSLWHLCHLPWNLLRAFHSQKRILFAEKHSFKPLVQVNYIRLSLARRAEAERMLKLLTTHPSAYDMIPKQQIYSILDVFQHAASDLAALKVRQTRRRAANVESESSC